MEIRGLRSFLAIAAEGNMTRASERLHLSQPTLSRQVRLLETELGGPLFERHGSHLELTEMGELLRLRATDLVGMSDSIERECHELGNAQGGVVSLGLAESAQVAVVARAMHALREERTGLIFHVTSGDTEQVAWRLDRGVLDLALVADEPNEAKYHALRLPSPEAWGVVVRADDPLTALSSVQARDLVGRALMCSPEGWNRDVLPWAGDLVPQLEVAGTFRLPYNGSLFVREGVGALIVWDGLIDTSPTSGLAFRPLDPALHSHVTLAWSKARELPPAAQRLLELVRQEMATLAPASAGDIVNLG